MKSDTLGTGLGAVLAGEEAAVAGFVRTSTPLIAGVVRGVLLRSGPGYMASRLQEDVDDVVQQVLMALFANGARLLRRFDPSRASLATFLRQVTRSRTVDHIRRRAQRPWEEPSTACDVLERMAGAVPGPDVEERLAERQTIAQAFASVADVVNPIGANLLEPLFVEEWDADTLAAETGLTRGAVNKWRSRLRQRLRGELTHR